MDYLRDIHLQRRYGRTKPHATLHGTYILVYNMIRGILFHRFHVHGVCKIQNISFAMRDAVDVVPYGIAMGLMYIYHEHRIYGITCTHKICFVSVGAIHESPVNVDTGLRDIRVLMRQQNDGGWNGGGRDVPYEIAVGFGANKHHEMCWFKFYGTPWTSSPTDTKRFLYKHIPRSLIRQKAQKKAHEFLIFLHEYTCFCAVFFV